MITIFFLFLFFFFLFFAAIIGLINFWKVGIALELTAEWSEAIREWLAGTLGSGPKKESGDLSHPHPSYVGNCIVLVYI